MRGVEYCGIEKGENVAPFRDGSLVFLRCLVALVTLVCYCSPLVYQKAEAGG
jgi:hypothetical protein